MAEIGGIRDVRQPIEASPVLVCTWTQTRTVEQLRRHAHLVAYKRFATLPLEGGIL
jgi:hypothetical protein